MLPAPQITKNNDGTETHISYRWRDDGKKVRTTRIVRKTVTSHKVNPRVAERRAWAKFGASARDPAGPQHDTTSVGENIELAMRANFGKAVAAAAEEQAKGQLSERELQKEKLKSATVKCRICNGEHFTARCPFKGTMAPEGEPPAGDPIADPMVEAPGGAGAGKSGKYVPPSQRAGAAGGGEKMGGRFERDDLATLRVTNVSVTADDVEAGRLLTETMRRSQSMLRSRRCATCSTAGAALRVCFLRRTARLDGPRDLRSSALRTALMRPRRARRWTAMGTTTSSCASSLRRRRLELM